MSPPTDTSTPAAAGSPAGRDLERLVRERSILVCCGTGGVGKTTISAVLAMAGARAGRRTVVVTIDPAKRLADTLGLDNLTNEPTRLDGPWTGELWALMLDTKGTFDDLVLRHAASPEQAERILSNGFYRNISGALSGTQEYMAAEKLYSLHEERGFDLVVVDTPPTRHALDFLDAPRRLTRFLDHRLYRLVLAPTRTYLRAVSVAAQTFLRTVTKVAGADVLADAITFFQAFEGMETGFRDRAARVMELLAQEDTAYVLVASARRDTVEEATFFAGRLRQAGLPVAAVIVNRLHPRFGDGVAGSERARARAAAVAGTALAGLYTNLADLQLIAAREEDELVPLLDAAQGATVVRVPFLPSDVHDLDGLATVSEHLFR